MFLKKKLRFGGDKLKRVKSVLRKLDLIDYVRGKDNDGKEIYYIHIRHVWGYDPIIELGENCHALRCKKYLIETYGELNQICTSEDIGLEEMLIDDEEVGVFDGQIYFHDGCIKIKSYTEIGERQFAFPTHRVNDIIRRTYNYAVENMF